MLVDFIAMAGGTVRANSLSHQISSMVLNFNLVYFHLHQSAEKGRDERSPHHKYIEIKKDVEYFCQGTIDLHLVKELVGAALEHVLEIVTKCTEVSTEVSFVAVCVDQHRVKDESIQA